MQTAGDGNIAEPETPSLLLLVVLLQNTNVIYLRRQSNYILSKIPQVTSWPASQRVI